MKQKKKKSIKIDAPYLPESEYTVMCDKNGKTWEGARVFEKLVWEVKTPCGGGFTCEDQFQAEVLSTLYDIQKRLKKLEHGHESPKGKARL
jgi:hypothetical protein